uniref:Uncharacterized protein n=1 Tax=Oreochromis niloticus TaxID=8128 RepID=A0A669BBF5_ORENI
EQDLLSLKQKRHKGFTTLPLLFSLPIFLPFFTLTHTHTHIFTIHTHTGLSFESLGLDLKFLFRACHAFYMHGEWERERRDCGGRREADNCSVWGQL